MDIEQQDFRVVKQVNSKESWEFLIAQASTPVFVHFTASWCVPSISMNSFIEELATNYQNIQFLVVDVDDVKEVASKMEVKAMPTFVLMKDGEVKDRLVGANPEEIKKRIEACLSPTSISE